MTEQSAVAAAVAEPELDAGAEVSSSRSGKYLTFKLGKEEYGVGILRVTTIIGLMEITSVPQTPPYIRGVINLRGKVIPVMDMRARFGMEPVEDTAETCVIVVEVSRGGEAIQVGLLVDSVSEVLDIADEDIESTPSFGNDESTEFILGMAKTNGDVKILLDIEKVLAGDGEPVSGV